MIQVTPQMRILLAVELVDFRKGIDSLAALCRQALQADPFDGTLFVFCGRSRRALKCLVYDSQGFWLCQKRLSQGRFTAWPKAGTGISQLLTTPQLHTLLWNGDPAQAHTAPAWRRLPGA
jgi:transposase